MGIPLYRTIFETLQDEIRGGRYQDAFPSEARLIRRFAVGRHTILRVIRDLVEAGLIERRRGSDSVVSRRVRQKLGDVGLILPSLTSTPFTNALAAVCKEAGYTMQFHELGIRRPMVNSTVPIEKRMKDGISFAKELVGKNIMGVVMQPLQLVDDVERINGQLLAAFQKRRIPVVLVDHDACTPPARSACDIVCMDNFHAGYAIARHLIERGAKKIAVYFRKNYAPSVMERMHGVAMAVSEAGLAWNMSKNVFDCQADDKDKVASALRKFHADAIVCGNDIYAARLLNTLRKLGVSVPGDIRVTGMDDVSFAALLSPALTTIRQDFAQIARVAAERLIWRIRNPDAPPVTIQIPGELVIREST